MREILFRGKTENGEWYEGSLLKETVENANEKKDIYRIKEFNIGFLDDWTFEPTYTSGFDEEVIPETVGQYTGLTDKNGKKIFEGDICQTKGFPLIDDKPFVVEWNSDECSFYWRDVLGTDEFNIGVSQNTTIIGNIHDNPELLKGE